METLQRTANRGSISTGYDIDNSLKFEDDNTENLYRNLNASTSTTKFTISMWAKRTEIGDSYLLYLRGVAGNESVVLRFATESASYPEALQVDIGAGGTNSRSYTKASFRDTSAWYHIVLAVDTTQSTATDRFKLYVNGVLETEYASRNNPAQNFAMEVSSAKHRHGAYNDTDGFAGYCGYIAECHYVDGSQVAQTEFGEFDDDTGIWKPKAYTGSYGTGGYYLDFSDSSALGNNSAGDGTDFTLNNITAADQATDTPTNNFTTWNTIRYFNAGVISFKEGGTVVDNNFNGGFSAVNNNIRMGKGKWYAEFEVTVSGNILMNGNVDADYIDNDVNAGFYLGSQSDKTAGAGYYSSGTTGNDTIYYEGTFTSSGVTTSAGDIISVAIDCDNNKVHFAVNGSWTNSSDPATNTNGFAMTDNEQYFALASIGVRDYKANFGGYTTSTISTPASDGNGYGTFEYAPPSGYYALCTKNLAEYG